MLGSELGRYRVTRLIAEGGMGRVYEGVDVLLGNRVAIKVLAKRFAHDRELAVRMAAEARVVNLIDSRHIVRALEFEILDDGRPVIVMELVAGNRLRDLLAAGPAPLGGVVDVMLQVLDAVAAAHAVGIIHRDLKPDNILVAHDGHVRVVDFGIAKLAQPNELAMPRTRVGVVLGTPEYMAPEHITGSAVDERADLYALGVVLFEAIARRRPFEGSSDFEVMRAHVEAPIPSVCAVRPDVPDDLDAVLHIALAKQPRDRFASAAAMANALRAAARALPHDEWRSLAPSAAWLSPPSRPAHAAVAPDAQPGRLDVKTVAARPGTLARRRDAAAAAPHRRERWIGAALATIVIAAALAIAFAVRAHAPTDARAAAPPDAAVDAHLGSRRQSVK